MKRRGMALGLAALMTDVYKRQWLFLARQFSITEIWRFLLPFFRRCSGCLPVSVPASIRFTRQSLVNRKDVYKRQDKDTSRHFTKELSNIMSRMQTGMFDRC